MSVTGISTEGGGGAGTTATPFYTGCGTTSCLPPSSISTSSQLNFTATLTLPVPPPGSTTLTSLVTISPTSITTTTTATTSSNFISTTTATSLSVTPLPNPAATAALAAESSLLNQNATLSRTNLTVTIVLGSVSFVLLLALLILLLFYLRKRSSKSDSESPPFTSLAPRPAPNFAPAPPGSPPPQIPLPEHMCETSLSMGPRGGPADPYSRALAGGLTPSPIGGQRGPSQQQGAGAFQFEFPYPSGSGSQAQALASNPVSPPTRNRLMRSSSAPTSAPEPAPTIPALQDMPRISLFPATPFSGSRDSVNTARPGTSGEYSSASGGNRPPTSSSATFGAPLRRQRSAPMYHRALQEQVEQEREESRSREAQRLGVPVIGVVGRDSGERGSYGSEISSEMSFGSEDVEIGIEDEEKEEGEEEDIRAEGSGTQAPQQSGTGERGRVLHSTRASSGVFPGGEEEDDEDDPGEKNIYS